MDAGRVSGYLLIIAGFFVYFPQSTPVRLYFPPSDCLPMSNETYDPYRHKGMTKEIVETFTPYYQRILYCKYGCCGDGSNNGMQCCLADDDSSSDTLKMVSIIAAGIIGLLLVGISLVHYVKAHNKKKRMVADIQNLQRSGKPKRNNKKKAKQIKVGEYQRDQLNKGDHSQSQWNQVPQGNIFVTKPTLPSIPAMTKTPSDPYNQPGGRRDPSDFSAIIPAAGDGPFVYQSPVLNPGPAPAPPTYNPDQEVLKSIIANLPGPKVMPTGDSANNHHSPFYSRY